ncbi:MAG: hypothetical protein FJX23_00490 [Alphaproteobacteria bacterium]|nr:hypothetical protein [Alphaproteobacteria bacterium]
MAIKVILLIIMMVVAVPLGVKFFVGAIRGHFEEQKATFEYEKMAAKAKSAENLKNLFLLSGGLLLFVFIIGKWPVN